MKGPECPYCGNKDEAPDEETYFDGDEFPDLKCDNCGRYYHATVHVEFSWTTEKGEIDTDEQESGPASG